MTPSNFSAGKMRGLKAWQNYWDRLLVGQFSLPFTFEGLPLLLKLPGIGAVNLGLFGYFLFILFWLVGFSNAINLTGWSGWPGLLG